MLKKAYRHISTSLLTAAFAVGVYAQNPTPTPKIDDDIIKVESRLVVVPVSVTDASGNPVTGLKVENFQLSEEGRKQTVDQVTDAENTPLEIALLIDVSGSVNPLFDLEIKSASQFLKSVMKAEDRATIFLIGDKPISNLTREDSAAASTRVLTVVPSGKFTAFYDTVSLAAGYLQKNAPLRSRKVILALTDGEDNWSNSTRDAEMSAYRNIDINSLTQEKRNQLAATTDTSHTRAQNKIVRELQNADTVFFAINPAGNSYKLNKISLRAQTGMARFANETGGASLLPNFLPINTKDPLQNSSNTRRNEATLAQIFRQLENELRAQYLVQFYSESDFPLNKYVKLDVGVINRGSVKVRAREGYYVKK